MTSAPPAPTYGILGVRMSILNIPDAVRRIVDAVESGKKGYICVTGMHGIMEARDDAHLQNILNKAFLCTPDGMPTVWFGKAKGHKEMDRVYGPDLMLAVMAATQNKPIRHFFYGGAEGVAEDLKRRLEARFPGLQVSGTYCPPFRPLNDAERSDLRRLVEESEADILWVGLSTPKQERFMAEFLPQLPVKLMLGVGAAFDFHTARARQAPRWMQRSGLEWFFRLITEPKRLGRRYLTQVPRFAVLLGLDRIGMVSHSSERPEMPAAFKLMAHWPAVFFVSLAGWIASTLGIALISGGALALGAAGWLAVPLLLFLLSVLALHASADNERVDRPGPTAALVITILTGALALSGPPAAFLAGVFQVPAFALPLAKTIALLAALPCALFAVSAAASTLFSKARHT